MKLLFDSIPRDLLILCGLAVFIVLARALLRAPWRHLREPARLNLLLGATVATAVLWNLAAGVSPGLGIHYLAVTTLSIMFGWEFAFLIVLAALGTTVALGDMPLALLPLNAILSGIVPIAVSFLLYRWVVGRLPRNPFLLILACGFFGGMLAMMATLVATVLFMSLIGLHSFERMTDEYLIYMPLLLMSEGILNGFIVTSLVVFSPQNIWTIDVEKYSRGP